MASENIPLQIIKDLSAQTLSDKRKELSKSDTQISDSKPEPNKDTGHPPTIMDVGSQHNDHGTCVIDSGDKWNDQPLGVSKDGHGDMPKIKSTIIVPELVADNSGDVPKTITPKSNSKLVADDHDGEITKTRVPQLIEDDHSCIQNTLVPAESSLVVDDQSDNMKTTASKFRSEAEDPGGIQKTEASESKLESMSDNHADAPKITTDESNSEEVADEHDDAPKTTAHESNSEEISDEHNATKTEALENRAVTESMPFDLELDLVLDDQVMSFVNLAISNATKSIRLHDQDEHISDEIKNTETLSESGEESGKPNHDEKQSIDDDACQLEENETQNRCLISRSHMEKAGNKANTKDTRELQDIETTRDPTLPEDLTIADRPTRNFQTIVVGNDDDDVQGGQEDLINEQTTENLQMDTKCAKNGIGEPKVSCKEAAEPEKEKNKESESHSQKRKSDLPDVTSASGIQRTVTSKDNESQRNGKSDAHEELTQCFTESIMQDEPYLTAKNKDQPYLLHRNESDQDDNNDKKTKVLSENGEGDLHKEENAENKQEEISATTKNTELKQNISKSSEDDYQKRYSINNQDTVYIMKTDNRSGNQFQNNEGKVQQKDNAENTQDNRQKTKPEDENTNDSRNEEVGIPVKKVDGVIDVRVSSDEVSDMKLSEELSMPESRQDDSVRESGLALVNDRLRIRIAELQSQIKDICGELAFVGDRNWRLEAYTECLIHTLEKMGVTDIEDLDQTTLPLELFKVKVKAGYRLGPYNGLPQRARRSYRRDGITPPTIDLSGGTLTCRTIRDSKSKLPFSISGTDDIGLSVKQMQQYEAHIETLTMKNHFLETQLQHLRNANLNIGILPRPDGPFPLCQPVPQGICQPAGLDHFGGIPTVPSVPSPQIMQPMVPQVDINHGNTNMESSMADSMASTQQSQSPKPAFSPPLPPTEADPPKVSSYVPPPRFRNKVGPHATTSLQNTGRRNGSGCGSHRNDGWYGRGRSATELTTSGPSWRRTERASQSSTWRRPSQFN